VLFVAACGGVAARAAGGRACQTREARAGRRVKRAAVVVQAGPRETASASAQGPSREEALMMYEPDSFEESDRMQAELEVLRLAVGPAGFALAYALGSRQLQRFEFAVHRLEQLTAMKEVNFPASLTDLDGKWKLLYSSVPIGVPPGLRVYDVSQTVDATARRFENEVVFAPAIPWRALSSRAPQLRFALGGTFEVHDKSTLSLEISDASLAARDPSGKNRDKSLPPFSLQPPREFMPDALRMTGRLETTYLSRNMRVGRGDRGELRVFVRT